MPPLALGEVDDPNMLGFSRRRGVLRTAGRRVLSVVGLVDDAEARARA